jgi:hypothetical protein
MLPALVTDAVSASQHFHFFTVYSLCTKYAVCVRRKFKESIRTDLHTAHSVYLAISHFQGLCVRTLSVPKWFV